MSLLTWRVIRRRQRPVRRRRADEVVVFAFGNCDRHGHESLPQRVLMMERPVTDGGTVERPDPVCATCFAALPLREVFRFPAAPDAQAGEQ